jgi:hypothetical protein
MLQAFTLRSSRGQAFLIVAIIFAYLRKSGVPGSHRRLLGYPASVAATSRFGYVLKTGVNQSLWEGVLGLSPSSSSLLVFTCGGSGGSSRRCIRLGRVSALSEALQPLSASSSLPRSDHPRRYGDRPHADAGSWRISGGRNTRTRRSYGYGPHGLALAPHQYQRFHAGHQHLSCCSSVQIAIYTFHEFAEAGVFPNSGAWHRGPDLFSRRALRTLVLDAHRCYVRRLAGGCLGGGRLRQQACDSQ